VQIKTGRQYRLGPNRSLYVFYEDRADHVKASIVEDKNGKDRVTIQLPLADAFDLADFLASVRDALKP
jgi:hypothetical protein